MELTSVVDFWLSTVLFAPRHNSVAVELGRFAGYLGNIWFSTNRGACEALHPMSRS